MAGGYVKGEMERRYRDSFRAVRLLCRIHACVQIHSGQHPEQTFSWTMELGASDVSTQAHAL
jgi:hypothetical protein